MRYDHLLGHVFEMGRRDCYSLIRDFYRDNFGIGLPNFARPAEFWRHGLDLYGERYHRCGFRPLDCHPSDYRPGDLVFMGLRSQFPNHAGLLVDRGQLLHHLHGRLSTVEPYGGAWRDTTLAVLRHKDAVPLIPTETVDLHDLLPEHVRSRIASRDPE